MANPRITQDHIGTQVIFRSKAGRDETVWKGTITGLCDYETANMVRPVLPYNAMVRNYDPSVSDDLTTLSYFLLKLEAGAGGEAQRQSFAQEWIKDNSLQFVDPRAQHLLLVYDLPNVTDATALIRYLNAGGYKAVLKDDLLPTITGRTG